jgi:hypothetical protein
LAADDRFSDGEIRRGGGGGGYGGGRDADRRSSPRRYGDDNSRPQRYNNRDSSYERAEDDGPYSDYSRSAYSSRPAYRDYRDEPPKRLRDSFQGVMLYGVAPVLAALQVRAGSNHSSIHATVCLPAPASHPASRPGFEARPNSTPLRSDLSSLHLHHCCHCSWLSIPTCRMCYPSPCASKPPARHDAALTLRSAGTLTTQADPPARRVCCGLPAVSR